MSYSSRDIFKRPQCLLNSSIDGVMSINENVLRDIAFINTPIVVVAVVGLYRTGKSYLMNRLGQATKGFQIGSSIEATTKGIWVWCKKHPTQPNTTLLLMDTEGLGDVQKGDQDNDNKLFTLTVLLCDGLCYNNIGVINEDFIEKLALSSKLSGIVNNSASQHMSLRTPVLIVCLRDFCLDLEIQGQVITSDEYLEHCLKSDSTDKNHDIKTEIKRLFVHRKCYTFECPGEREVLGNIENQRDEDLSAGFLDEMKRFTTYVHTIQPGNMPDYARIDGPAFSSLLKGFVGEFQRQRLPNIRSSFERWAAEKKYAIVGDIITYYIRQLKSVKLPILETTTFKLTCDEHIQNCLRDVQEILEEDGGNSESQVRTSMEKTVRRMKMNNDERCYRYWYDQITALYRRVVGCKQKYFYIGGYKQYRNKIRTLKSEWKVQNQDDERRKRAYNTFMETNDTDEDEILKADMNKRKQEEQEHRRVLKERQEKELQQQMQELQRRLAEFKMENERIRKLSLMEESQRKENHRREVEKLQYEHEEYMRQHQKKSQHLEQQCIVS